MDSKHRTGATGACSGDVTGLGTHHETKGPPRDRLDRPIRVPEDQRVTATRRPNLPTWYSRPGSRGWRCAPAPAGIRGFHAELPDHAVTPLVELPPLAGELGVRRVFVKDESLRLGLPAFKALGASWAVASVIAQRAGLTGPLTLAGLRVAVAHNQVTLVTASDGNHGRAVARIAAQLGLRARVFVPEVISAGAAAAIAAEGATVTTVPDTYDHTVQQAAVAAAADPAAVLVQDTARPGYEQIPGWIVQGYDTLLAEVDDQLQAAGAEQPDLVVVPVGVGSLAQAVVTHYRSGQHITPPSVLSVEPDTAACVLRSLTNGSALSVQTAATTMAGLNCGTPSSLAWPYLHQGLDAAVAVTDGAATRAVKDLARLGVSSGPSGAATLAGVRAALTGESSNRRRTDLGISADSVVVLLSTEGTDSTVDPAIAPPAASQASKDGS